MKEANMSQSRRGPLIAAGILLGAGMGGFFDGILLHQLLQWHNMLSSVRPPTDLVAMKYNMVWDGLFHAATWLMVALGVWRLWSVGKRRDVVWSGRVLLGALALGWGIFNVSEGLVDHQLLGIHHVHPGSHELSWDLGFIGLGVLLLCLGLWAVRAGAALSGAMPRYSGSSAI